ncbi:MAG: [LysW]-lysine hydrolase [Planctomycetota bacterium]
MTSMEMLPIVRADDAFATDLLVSLVWIQSVSGQEHQAVTHLLQAADALGLETELDAAGNAIARRGIGEPQAHIVLLGHIDTVPGDVPVRVDGDILHGRGSVDAKGPLCALLIAAARAELPAGVRIDVVGAVGEETPHSPGANALVDRWRPDACIVGEPSGWDGITLGYKGRLVVEANVMQDCAHGAGPDGSACDAMLSWWHEVRRIAADASADRTGSFDTVQASVLSMDSASDGMQSSAALRAGFRLPLDLAPDDLQQRIEACAPEGMHLSFIGHERAVCTDRNDAVVRALSSGVRRAGGRPRPKRKTGTADMNVVGPRWRCPIAAYGPGDSALDHRPDEHISVTEYLRSIRVLTSALEALATELVAPAQEEVG